MVITFAWFSIIRNCSTSHRYFLSHTFHCAHDNSAVNISVTATSMFTQLHWLAPRTQDQKYSTRIYRSRICSIELIENAASFSADWLEMIPRVFGCCFIFCTTSCSIKLNIRYRYTQMYLTGLYVDVSWLCEEWFNLSWIIEVTLGFHTRKYDMMKRQITIL